jgi:site-specific DNA-methyltransferase (adenine-specific)
MRCIEDICVFYKKKPTYNPQGLKRLEQVKIRQPIQSQVYSNKKNPSVQTHTGYPKHLLEFDNEAINHKQRFHPTQKPVKLLEYLIKTYTNEGDIILDNCMGSGSTGVAAVNTNRRFYGIEKDDKYFEIAKQRINDAVFSM